jgi:hypothetical protein
MGSCGFTPDRRSIGVTQGLGRVLFLRLIEAEQTQPTPKEKRIRLLLREEPVT